MSENEKDITRHHVEHPALKQPEPKYKKFCHACIPNYSKMSEEEKREVIDHTHPIQYLVPCCPKKMIIKCSCGDIEEKFPLSVIALWLRTAYTPQEQKD